LLAAASHIIPGSNQIYSEPRRFNAALYSLQFVVRYFGVAGFGIQAIYTPRFPQKIPAPVMQQSHLSASGLRVSLDLELPMGTSLTVGIPGVGRRAK
jgi:hypothetical protein